MLSTLESRERQATVDFERRARDISDQLLGAVASDETLLKDPDWLGDILTHAIAADGVGVWIAGNHAFSGTTPSLDDFRKIVRALNSTAAGKVYATDHIGALVPGFSRSGLTMIAGVAYDRIDDDGLHLTVDGEQHLLPVDTVVLCAGQEPRRELYEELLAAGRTAHLIGGADVAAELDAKRAIRQGTELAAAL